jgi:hypothetical protein
VKTRATLPECTEEEKVIEDIHVSIKNFFFAVSFRAKSVDVTGFIPSHRLSPSLCDEPYGEEFAEFFHKLAELLCLVAVWDYGLSIPLRVFNSEF